MNKTIYLPDEEADTWEKARRLANDRLSPVLLKALKEFVAAKEAEAAGFERIQIKFEDSDDNNLPKIKAFHGKWIIPPDESFILWNDESVAKGHLFSVATTVKGNVVVYSWKRGRDTSSEGEPFEYDWGHRFLVFRSFEEAAANSTVNHAVREALQRRGVPVEELDI
jgi:hypothetical protein